jgi:hypothetical protein
MIGSFSMSDESEVNTGKKAIVRLIRAWNDAAAACICPMPILPAAKTLSAAAKKNNDGFLPQGVTVYSVNDCK